MRSVQSTKKVASVNQRKKNRTKKNGQQNTLKSSPAKYTMSSNFFSTIHYSMSRHLHEWPQNELLTSNLPRFLFHVENIKSAKKAHFT